MAHKKLIEFEHEGKKYYVAAPTQEELLELDMAYRRAFSRAVREGLMTEFEAKRVFDRNGTWTQEHEEEIHRLQMAVVTMELELDKIEPDQKDGADGRKLCFDIMETRSKLLDLINHKTRLFSQQTAEGYADAVRVTSLTQLCTRDEAGERVFATPSAFSQRSDDAFAATCYSKAMLASAGLKEKDLEMQIPERTWLEENGYINTAGMFTQKYYEEIIGKEDIEKAEKRAAKKSTKKKTAKRKAKKRVVKKGKVDEKKATDSKAEE
jgi:hypothetical protein